MKKSIKAALLSALVIPGAGHFLLKKVGAGIALCASALTALCFLLSHIVERAQEIVEKVRAGEIPADIQAISDGVMSQSSTSDSLDVKIATAVLVIVWVVGIVHSYLLGRQQEN